ncbi:serine/threonine-protein kinase [Amycolatopsis sp. H20-H5]|uniref:serine/threonine-protein kinase n=1 Tax=Amycolatopsis sp. H20-H5 TaxID=3046309 RepID=UPI002DBCF874|nr:serine/threonine-protein kinase [Amycolatopsis sp. H20-H5]MEC3982749.1 serine/threonine-protein kinase [Amycolatopsis sp. H20-H5]
MPEESRLIAGRYRLDVLLGSGAMGIVWRAEDQWLHRPVAVKELHLQTTPDLAQLTDANTRAMREGRIAARLLHHNAIAVFDVVEDDGRPCLILEYLPSSSLADVITARGTLPPVEVAKIGAQIASALAAAHAAEIVHRDVKPANVLIAEDGTAKITDFGISRAAGDVTVTATGITAGTPGFLSPDVARGGDADFRSDVFSLGATLFNAVEGGPPFGTDDNAIALLHRVARGTFDEPKKAGALTPALMHMLQLAPEDRPTMAEAAEILAELAAKLPPAPLPEPPSPAVATTPVPAAAVPPTPPAAEPVKDSRKRLVVLLSVVIGLVVIAGVALVLAASHTNSNTNSNTNAAGSSPSPSAPAASSEAQSFTPPPATTPATTPSATPPAPSSPPSTAPAAPLTGPAANEAAVRDYYAMVPGNLAGAYARLTDRFKQARSKTFASYSSFWNQMSEVKVTDVTAHGDNAVSVTITYVRKSGGTTTEHQTYTLAEQGGQLGIDSQA